MKEDNLSLSNLANRAVTKKPTFWQKVQNLALITGAVAGTVLTAGAALPAVLTTIATYAAVISGTIVTVSQFTKEDNTQTQPNDSTEPAK